MKTKTLSNIYTAMAILIIAAPFAFAVLAILQLCHVINWSWWLVTSPLWGTSIVLIAFFAVMMLVAFAARSLITKDTFYNHK